MEILEAMQARHSVRSYLDKKIPEKIISVLQSEIDRCNREGDLHIQMIIDEPKAFDGMMAHYGKFTGVQNYIALIGKKSGDLEERIGYYGERIALKAQTLGLNTCWVAMTFSKGAAKKHCTVSAGESGDDRAHRHQPAEIFCAAFRRYRRNHGNGRFLLQN